MPTTKKKIHPLRRKPAGGQKRGQNRDRKPTARSFDAVLWTTTQAVEYSGLKHKYILDLIRTGAIPSVRLGPGRDDTLPDGRVRHRSCAKFMLVSRPFRRFVERLAARGKLQRSA